LNQLSEKIKKIFRSTLLNFKCFGRRSFCDHFSIIFGWFKVTLAFQKVICLGGLIRSLISVKKDMLCNIFFLISFSWKIRFCKFNYIFIQISAIREFWFKPWNRLARRESGVFKLKWIYLARLTRISYFSAKFFQNTKFIRGSRSAQKTLSHN
jgi:hypothetical protein